MNNKIKLNGLDSIRFIAALIPFFVHFEIFAGYFEKFKNIELAGIKELLGVGPTFFFVLSGYLITYILLVEKKLNNNIKISYFYIRRILRIIPLYYLILVISFVIIPEIDLFSLPNSDSVSSSVDWKKKISFFLLFPQIGLFFNSEMPYIEHTWFIGVEILFYLFWPVLLKYSKNINKPIFLIIVIMAVIKIITQIIFNNTNGMNSFFVWFFHHNRFECMAIGAFFASIIYKQNYTNGISNTFGFYSLTAQIIAYNSLIFIVYMDIKFPDFINYQTLYALIFGLIIFNISGNKKSIIKLNNKVFRYFGNISYGIYMFRPLVLGFCFKILQYYNIDLRAKQELLIICIMSFSLIIIISFVSYFLFEKHFLYLKKFFRRY